MDSEKNLYRYAKNGRGMRQHTFTFTLAEVTDGTANSMLDQFCDAHNVYSVVFAAAKNAFVYVVIYKDWPKPTAARGGVLPGWEDDELQ